MLCKAVSSSLMTSCILLMAMGCSDDTLVHDKNVFDDTVIQQQNTFCRIINDYRIRYESIDDGPGFIDKESTLQTLFDDRTQQIKQLLGKGGVHAWQGTINDIVSVQGTNKVRLKVSLGCNTELYTSDELLIQAGTALYNRLRHYKEGSRLVFSGRFIISPNKIQAYPYNVYFGETSLTQSGSIKYPEFHFEFTEFYSEAP